ncbi:MAG TPA: hypothetical protein VK810_03700, partial [Dongiaceae bacterium]|nr:hypothetical protein [Dongiaceae bacterium]
HWDWATQWSTPKKETLSFFVPGLFGYRMDTPNNMMAFQDEYKGGQYWGGIGRTPEIDRYFDSGKTDSPPPGMMRFSGGVCYAGVLVSLIAFWAIAQSLRRKNSVFTESQKKLLWFWLGILIVSLFLSWGRFAPFYKLFYMLPYASTMRNPCKFSAVFSWAFVVIFAYGVHGLSRRYLDVAANVSNSFSTQLKSWWARIRGFDRKWTQFSIAAAVVSVLAWLVYAAEKKDFVKYLQTVGFGDEGMASDIAAFSIGQVGWFVLIFALAAGIFILVTAGIFSGRRAQLGGILLGVLVVADLMRADLPWVIHWDYKQKYEVGSLNPIEKFLSDKPYEHRVAYSPPSPFSTPRQYSLFQELYGIEWTQHHFVYYNIQSLDYIQNPRPPADLAAFEGTLAFHGTPETIPLIARRWQLTNTRYFLGPAGFLDVMNQQLDPDQHRFRIVTRFSVVPKPGITQATKLEELTAAPNNDGDYALFEFTGALPRAKLYSTWQVSTNDTATLQMLADKNFDAQQTVLVPATLPTNPADGVTNQNSGAVEFKSYAPKDIVLGANATAPSVLLFNDKYDPLWRALVDGKDAPIFRANYIMRGIYLTPGAHTVEFRFYVPNRPLYITLTAIVVGILLSAALIFLTRKPKLAEK